MARLVGFFTLEFLLERWPNGGPIILWRAAFSGVLLFLIGVFLHCLVTPGWGPSPDVIRQAISERFEWLGPCLAGPYAAFYARFSSQWTYLAELYNQIKLAQAESECGSGSEGYPRALYELMAGFMCDAVDLHLAKKTTFKGVIESWYGEFEGVREAFNSAAVTKSQKALRDTLKDAFMKAAASRSEAAGVADLAP